MSAFGKMLDHLVRASAWKNPHAFAQANKGRVPSVSHLGNMIRGTRPPTGRELHRLADALELGGATRERFFRLGWVATLDEEAQPDFELLVRDVEILRARARKVDPEGNG